MIHKIHRTSQEEQTILAHGHLAELQNHTSKLEDVKTAIKDLHESTKDKTHETIAATAIISNIREEIKVIDSLKDDINAPDKVIRKLEEVKSAALITNKLLKDISKKELPQPKEFPKELDMTLKGVSIVTIKGDRGEIGPIGPKGESIVGPKGDSIVGPRGPKGERGKDGVGKDGKDGESIVGPKGADGLNGSPDTSDEIITKINQSGLVIDIERIRGLAGILNQIEQIGMYPLGGGSSGKLTVETPPETPDSSQTVFTVSRTPQWVVADGITYYSGQGYTTGAGSITMTVPPSNYIRVYI